MQTTAELQARLTQVEETNKVIVNELHDRINELCARIYILENNIGVISKTVHELGETQLLTLEVVHDLDNRGVHI